MSCIRWRAATAASRRGRNSTAGVSLQGVGFRSHGNSNGQRCWIGCSMNPLPALNFAALTTPSRPLNNSSTTPMGHWFRFRSSDLMITTSSTDELFGLVLCLSWCLSRKTLRYSVVQRRYIVSLVAFKNFARILKSWSSRQCASSSGKMLAFRNSKEVGVSVGNCGSSST